MKAVAIVCGIVMVPVTAVVLLLALFGYLVAFLFQQTEE